MALKIKWNDDRVKGALNAILLVGRDRLARGQTTDLIQASLAQYRADEAGFKEARKTWLPAGELGPLKKPAQVAYYQRLIADTTALAAKWTRTKRQFNSLLELDNALVEQLKGSSSALGGECLGRAASR